MYQHKTELHVHVTEILINSTFSTLMKNIMLKDISEDIYFFILTSTFDLGIQLKIVALNIYFIQQA